MTPPGSSTDAVSPLIPPAGDSLPAEPVGVIGYDLPTLLQMAEANSPTLRAARAGLDQARGLKVQNTRYPNPTFGYQGVEIGNEGAAGQHGMYWSQTWVTNDKLRLAGNAADAEINRRGWLFHTQQQRIANQVRQRYYDLLAARRVVALSTRIADIAGSNLAAVEGLFEAGEVAKNILLQARVESQRARLAATNSQTALQTARRLLSLSLSSPEFDATQVQGSIRADVPNVVAADIVAWVQGRSPELAAARANLDRAKANVSRAVAAPIPNVNTQLGVGYDDATGSAFSNVQVGVAVPINNRNEGNISAAKAAARRAAQQVEQLQLDLKTRVITAFQQFDTARQRVETLRASMLPMAAESLKLTQEAYKIGEANYQTLLTAQRSYFDAALSLIEARRQLWQAVVRLQGLVVTE